jgi:hypothetical protein
MMGKNSSGFFGALIGSIVGVVLVGAYIIHKDNRSAKNDAPDNRQQVAEEIP